MSRAPQVDETVRDLVPVGDAEAAVGALHSRACRVAAQHLRRSPTGQMLEVDLSAALSEPLVGERMAELLSVLT